MRSFSEYNPIVIAVWFLSVTGIAMFCNYPMLMVISLVGAVAFFVIRNGLSHGKTHIFFWVLFLILALANPLVSHNGKTVL
ncbi:MAG: cobalt transport protein, partial [Ruminococcus sp.]|nr:cobalt transport protein [Ruminococcus sp.]